MDAADLSGQMAAMREWLDRHRYEPASPIYARAKYIGKA
jgi:hypothetical protein